MDVRVLNSGLWTIIFSFLLLSPSGAVRSRADLDLSSSARIVPSELPPSNVSTYTVNLDLPPEQRWSTIVPHFKDGLKGAQIFIQNALPAKYLPLVTKIAGAVDDFLGPMFGPEVRGIAAASGLPLGDIVLLNIIYDITSACTSVVGVNSNGTILHSRNQDYKFAPVLRNITAQLVFTRKNQTVFRATSFVGLAGIPTGVVPGGFSVSLDARSTRDGSKWENLFAAIFERAWPPSFLARQALQDGLSFQSALTRFQRTPVIAPVYIIIGGISGNEGAVITRARAFTVNTWQLAVSNGTWFLVETNYDHWEPAPGNDNRRGPANKAMNAIGQNQLTLSAMNDVLTIPPVLNNGTVYTTMMSASNISSYTTLLR